ncbi:hypothetical protein [Leptospira perdikensis]|uniref:Glycosyltransferase RgtA/B/C/D-like domain-containing protein n=1 Tax=Leptospira perdikensis TaxID=2484948 RepID=A0A4R9JES9_9LEPT|nr:hypothetical protein [Leptospira perdikensis]TGL37120.1 hypothetical protein EHQ49_12765 [Leptospira perdikensis]
MNAVKFVETGTIDYYWPMGYSLLLSVPIKMGFGNLFYLKLMNVAMSSGTVVFCYLISIRFIFNKKLRLVSVFFLIFYPEFIFYNSLLWNETAFIFFLSLLVYLYLEQKYFYSSVVFALSLFIKPVLIFFPLVLIIFDKSGRNKVKLFFTLYAAVIVIHLPWSFYLYTKTNHLHLVSSNGSTNLFIGNNKFATGHYDEEGLKNLTQFPSQDLTKNVLDFWFNQYQDIPLLVSKKIAYLIFPMPSPWVPSVGIGTNLNSALPRYIEKKELAKLLVIYPNDSILFNENYEMNTVLGVYQLRKGTDDFTKSTIADKLLYAGMFQYDLSTGFEIFSNFSFWLNIFLIAAFLIRIVLFGLKRNLIFFIPLYFILFYSIFFGDFRFFLPAMPFVIIGNFVSRRTFQI